MRGCTMKNVPLGRASRKNEKGSLSFGADDIYFGGTFGYFIGSRIIGNKSRGCFSGPNLMQDGRGSYKAGSSNTREIPSRSQNYTQASLIHRPQLYFKYNYGVTKGLFYTYPRYDSSSAKPLFRRQFTVSSNHNIFPLKISCDPAIFSAGHRKLISAHFRGRRKYMA